MYRPEWPSKWVILMVTRGSGQKPLPTED